MSASEKERENMSLYSVLLVDDEEEVFQVIMKKLDWEGKGAGGKLCQCIEDGSSHRRGQD